MVRRRRGAPRHRARRVVGILASAGIPACVAATPLRLPAQTTFEVQGGGSTLFGGYGSLLNFWNPRVDGWAGVGWQDGWRIGAFARTELNGDTLRLGNDVVLLRLPTDLFSSGTNVLVQGATLVRARGGGAARLFAGASSSGLQAPLFTAARAERPFAALQLAKALGPSLSATADLIAGDRQTALIGAEWQPLPGMPELTASGVGGVGANHPYGAVAAIYHGRRVDWRAALVGSERGFQRVAVPLPTRTEVDGVNFAFTLHPTDRTYVGVARQRFRRDSATAPSIVATASSITAGTMLLETRLMASLFRSELLGQVSHALALGAGRPLGDRLAVEYYFLRNDGAMDRSRSSVIRLRETISRRLQVSQHVSIDGGVPHGGVGGSVILPFGTLTADYQLQHMPFDPARAFRQSLVLSASLQLGDYRTSVRTQLAPDGRVAYSATGSTFLYLHQMGGVPPQTVGVSLERFLVRGIVRDEAGEPVEGAAIDVEGQVAYTSRSGEFFVRVPRPRAYRLVVLAEEFLGPERYAVVSLPETAPAARAADAVPAVIVVRRLQGSPPAPAPGAPPAR